MPLNTLGLVTIVTGVGLMSLIVMRQFHQRLPPHDAFFPFSHTSLFPSLLQVAQIKSAEKKGLRADSSSQAEGGAVRYDDRSA